MYFILNTYTFVIIIKISSLSYTIFFTAHTPLQYVYVHLFKSVIDV